MAHRVTTSHREVHDWAAQRAAQPARSSLLVRKDKQIAERDRQTGRANTDLTFIFTDTVQESNSLRFLSWQQFFQVFEDQGLALMYDDEQNSEYYAFVPRELANKRANDSKNSRPGRFN